MDMDICKEELWRIIDQAPKGILITDKNLNIIYINKNYKKLFIHNDTYVVGKNIGSFSDNEEYTKAWDIALKHGNAQIEVNGIGNSSFICNIYPIKDSQENIIFFIESREDISIIKKVEIELKNKNEELQNIQFQMIRQEKMASIGYLAAGIAHEINNPLGFISSNFESLNKYVGVLKSLVNKYSEFNDYLKNSQCEDALEKIKDVDLFIDENSLDFIYEDINNLMEECTEGIERIRDIVKGLRLFSHEAAQEKFEEYDLNNAIRNTLIIAKNEIKYYANVNLNLRDIPFAEVISGHINQVLLNIIVNAVYAIKEKNANTLGNISISTYNDEKYVYCIIEDDGVGISKENLSKIFKTFFTTKPSGKGTGLGLSISYDLIKNKNNGDILVDSIEGKGAKFIIKLPIKQSCKREF